MKYVITGYGGFKVPQEIADKLGCGRYNDSYNVRTNPTLIEWVETHHRTTELAVVNIPNEATDWEIEEYDGHESMIAVINGKIVHLRHN